MNETRSMLRAREHQEQDRVRQRMQQLSERVGAEGAVFAEIRNADTMMCWARPLASDAAVEGRVVDGAVVGEALVEEIRRPDEESFRRFQAAFDRTKSAGADAELFGASDVARVLIFNEDELVGWLGFFRTSGAFSPSELDVLSAEIERLGELVRGYGRAVDAAMEECAGLGLVFSSSENLAYRTELRGGCFDAADLKRFGQLCFEVREDPPMLRGWLLRVREVRGETGPGKLVEVEAAPRAARAADFALTEMQRRVAEYARSGATVSEIARAMERSPHTIKTHLKSVYERLGVASRLELAARLG